MLKYAVTQCTHKRFTDSSERPELAVLRISLSIELHDLAIPGLAAIEDAGRFAYILQSTTSSISA